MKQFGCLIVGFRRTSELELVMNQVRDEGFDKVFVSVDGSTGLSADLVKQNEATLSSVRDFVNHNHLDWNVLSPTQRLGIIGNFISSIDTAFESVDFLCILEDDCVPARGFLSYLKRAQELDIPDKVRIFTLFRPKVSNLSSGYFLTHNPLMWGWALSRENWNDIKNCISQEAKIGGIANFWNLPFQSFYYSGYVRAIAGESDALDALIAYLLVMKDLLVLGPPVNLISNIGFGETATHTKTKSVYMATPTSEWDVAKNQVIRVVEQPFHTLRNDYIISRSMNGWKFHHLISNVIKIEIQKYVRVT